MNFGAYLGNNLWQLASFPDFLRFQNGLHRLREEQERLLGATLASLEGTLYAQRYELDSKWSYQEFRQNLPLSGYQEQVEYFQAKGGILKEKVRVWEPTGGSTGGSKWIPWTAGLQAQFRRAVSAWIFDLFRSRPHLKRGRSYWQLTPKAMIQAPDWLQGERTGFESDGEYLGPLGRFLERLIAVQVQGQDEFWERTLRALRQAPDLTMLSCWSPSFLLLLKERAVELFGSWEPQHWWPQLALLSCWTHGPSAQLTEEIRETFPQVELEGKGLLSTEAVTTIPFQQCFPLAYRSHFFEFQDPEGSIWPSWQLESGVSYKVLQTTAAGLVRYDSGDVVRLSGFLGQVPCFHFQAREAVSDRFGEKLSHAYLATHLSCLGRFAALGFEQDAYVLFLDGERSEAENRACYERVNSALHEVYSYRDCRELGQLKELRCFLLEGQGWKQIAAVTGDDYARQKMSVLLPEGSWTTRLRGRFLEPAL